MSSATEATTTWDQALAWRMERHLLDPVGSASVADVVRRLGAVLSMDESLAELAVRTRSTTSRAGDLAQALADGSVIKAFAFRGSVHYLSPEDGGVYLALRSAGRQWELPSWVDYYRLAPSDWPDFRAAVREALSDGPLTVAELGDALTKHTAYAHLRAVFDEGAVTLLKPLTWQGDMSFGPPPGRAAHLPAPRHQPALGGHPRPRRRRSAGRHRLPSHLRAGDVRARALLARQRAERRSSTARPVDRRTRATSWLLSRSRARPRTSCARTSGPCSTRTPSEAVRFLPGHDQWVMGPGTKDVHVTPPRLRDVMTRKANPLVVGGVVRGTWTRKGDALTVSWLDARRRPDEAIEQEAARLGGILGADLHLRLAT